MMRETKNQSAITLIALVVTIVVLLILAGISIQMLKGDNGIVTKANEAKLESRAGNADDEVKMWKNNNKMIETQNKVTGKNDALVSKEEMLAKLIQDGIVYEKEIDRVKEIITIGKREIPYGEEIDKSALRMLVVSDETGKVKLPILETEEGRTIDWGDGTITTTEATTTHTYPEANKKYIITIEGNCKALDKSLLESYSWNDIIEIIQWGETGLEELYLASSTIEKIASPTEKSFEKITDFSEVFEGCGKLTSIPDDLFSNCPNVVAFERTFRYCTSLTSIPEKLFVNCTNVVSFEETFRGCTSLTSIPEDLFTNCSNVKKFLGTFYECRELKGEPIKLWERVPDGSGNGYKGIPNGKGCYYNATKLNNYESIPVYWRAEKGVS